MLRGLEAMGLLDIEPINKSISLPASSLPSPPLGSQSFQISAEEILKGKTDFAKPASLKTSKLVYLMKLSEHHI